MWEQTRGKESISNFCLLLSPALLGGRQIDRFKKGEVVVLKRKLGAHKIRRNFIMTSRSNDTIREQDHDSEASPKTGNFAR